MQLRISIGYTLQIPPAEAHERESENSKWTVLSHSCTPEQAGWNARRSPLGGDRRQQTTLLHTGQDTPTNQRIRSSEAVKGRIRISVSVRFELERDEKRIGRYCYNCLSA
ncbi:uncharacterized protein L3040_004475 [Drepanopeziza brunnea f. sp. 'multigermtubi']|uniref:uncharacterized protein n=1 Tax=Drepanopeziza brunnea f. sp. 'multigermtubi' TaxID=698441 RepID=UPI0023895C67|nr:hypothetical protein L3040_004475 [Drepanopeziza brunnea f. sp. 'multigermtubi']